MSKDTTVVLCNGARSRYKDAIVLNYRERSSDIKIKLPRFVKAVYHLPQRILDLLEIAAYVFAADRKLLRGSKDAVEYHSWSRKIHFIIKVRDFGFWNRDEVKSLLSDTLEFMSGDKQIEFNFQAGHTTDPVDLFDQDGFQIDIKDNNEIVLFSGGLDSLVGAAESLAHSKSVCLVSHQSGQPSTMQTQNRLAEVLNTRFPNMVKHYKFNCSLTGVHAKDENQRTRAFLYSSIAFALATAFEENSISVFENGVTSLNLSRRQDLINARSSRTTHPKTLSLLSKLLSQIMEKKFYIRTPYLFNTKTDVVAKLGELKMQSLVPSSVSCSHTSQRLENCTHCGTCYQCIDRRFALRAAGLSNDENINLYNIDIEKDTIEDGGARTLLVDYIRQAAEFAKSNIDFFYFKYAAEFTDIEPFVEGSNMSDKIYKIHKLCKKHGEQIQNAIRQIEDVFNTIEPNTLLSLVANRQYLKDPVTLCVDSICNKLLITLPIMFKTNKPVNENDLNDKIEGILKSEKENFDREYPYVKFALAKTVPDHSHSKILIEIKFPRGNTSKSTITDGIASDLTKYPADSWKLFIVYDPDRKIHDDKQFKHDFENRGNCTIQIIR